MFKYTCPSCGLTYYTKEKVEDAFCVSIKCGDFSTIEPQQLHLNDLVVENGGIDIRELDKAYNEALRGSKELKRLEKL